MSNKRLPGLQKCSRIGFTYPQRSAHVGITKGPSVRLNKMLGMSQPSYDGKKNSLCHYDLSRHLTSCLCFCRSHSMLINLFCYPCLFILSVKVLMLFNFIYYFKVVKFQVIHSSTLAATLSSNRK